MPEGRYLAREGEDERVLVVQALGAPRPGSQRRRRPRAVDAAPPEEVPVTRVTVTGAAFDDPAAGARWMERTAADRELRTAEIRTATKLLNRALGALRAAANDPLVQDVGATRALFIRLGYGDGDELSEGRWTEAVALPPPARAGRLDDVDPQSRVASVLAGRDRVHPAETLFERARLDIQQDRLVEARLGLTAARAALEQEPDRRGERLLARIAKAEAELQS